MKKPVGAGIILLNSKDQILLILRENIPTIPYPNMWDLPGGHVEEGENPEQTIRREMNEELELDLGEITLFKEYHHETFDEYVFLKKIDLNPDSMVLHEGQRLAYFGLDEILQFPLAYSYHKVLKDFFDSSRANPQGI
ncbi:MAG: NUDIX hydrolase [Bacteroidota bacterium]